MRSPARAFASPHKPSSACQSTSPLGKPSSLASASSNFPTSSDFFLKGKRNNWLGNSTSDLDANDASQAKKPKLPDHSSIGFGAYSSPKPTSLKPDTLAQLNQANSLHPPASLTAPYLNVSGPPHSSAATSVCAVNGDSSEDAQSLSPSSPAAPKQLGGSTPLGFSAFAKSSAFGGTHQNGPSSSTSTSVFDLPSDDQHQVTSGFEARSGSGGGKKTHLALAANLSEEDKHAGFGAKERKPRF